MKKYIIISLLILSSSIFAFGEKIVMKELAKEEIDKTISSISTLINQGKSISFTKVENNDYWYQSGNFKMKKDKNDFTTIYDSKKFYVTTDDKLMIQDTRAKIQIPDKVIEDLRKRIKLKANKIINKYFPKDNYYFVKVTLNKVGSTDGINSREWISMISVIYNKRLNGTPIIGHGSESRLFFKPSGELIGVKLNYLKSFDEENIKNNIERVTSDLSEINSYINSSYKEATKIKTKYLYIKVKKELIPYYSIIMIGKDGEKRARYIPLSEFNGIDSIKRYLTHIKDRDIGDPR